MIDIPFETVKQLMAVVDDVAWYLHYKENDQEAVLLLRKLRDAKIAVEHEVKCQKERQKRG